MLRFRYFLEDDTVHSKETGKSFPAKNGQVSLPCGFREIVVKKTSLLALLEDQKRPTVSVKKKEGISFVRISVSGEKTFIVRHKVQPKKVTVKKEQKIHKNQTFLDNQDVLRNLYYLLDGVVYSIKTDRPLAFSDLCRKSHSIRINGKNFRIKAKELIELLDE